MSDLIMTTDNAIDVENVVEIDPGTINQFVTPSTARKQNEVQAGRVSFAVNLELTQASATNQEGNLISQGNEVEDTGPGNESNNNEVGGSGGTQGGNRLSHWQDQDMADENEKHTIILYSKKKDGVMTKACIELSHGENVVTEAKTCHKFTEKFLKEEDAFSPNERIGVFGDQHAPFPFLAVSTKDNAVLVLHGIRKLVVPFSYSHKNNGDTIAFCGDTTDKDIFPKIVKLEEYDFEEACNHVHPEIKAIMNVTDGREVLSLPEDNAMVEVSKIIPLPTFLVPLFMNEGEPRNAVSSFQTFVDEFFQAAPNIIKKYTQYIFDFLLAASGSEDKEKPVA